MQILPIMGNWKKENRPFPSCPLPHFQNKSLCETIQMKMSFICTKMDVQVNSFSYEWFRMKTRFDTESKGNSEMAYSFHKKASSFHDIVSLFHAIVI